MNFWIVLTVVLKFYFIFLIWFLSSIRVILHFELYLKYHGTLNNSVLLKWYNLPLILNSKLSLLKAVYVYIDSFSSVYILHCGPMLRWLFWSNSAFLSFFLIRNFVVKTEFVDNYSFSNYLLCNDWFLICL